MSLELLILLAATGLGLIQIIIAAVAPAGQSGYRQWNAGPRDEPFEKSKLAGRLQRASDNFKETYIFFAAIILALAVEAKFSDISAYGATLYLIARVMFVPIYALGIPVVRSVVWLASLAGIVMCLAAFFL
jgi:uncharacterized MAPEG superfamily protein